MSLGYRLEWVQDYETVCYDGDGFLKPVTQSLIFATMSVEMGDITEANAAEFWARVNLWQKYIRAWYITDKGDVVITKEDVIAHIGLHTNVKERTRRQWLNGVICDWMNEDVQNLQKLLTGNPK